MTSLFFELLIKAGRMVAVSTPRTAVANYLLKGEITSYRHEERGCACKRERRVKRDSREGGGET